MLTLTTSISVIHDNSVNPYYVWTHFNNSLILRYQTKGLRLTIMGALVKLAAYLAPKAAELLKEGAKYVWEILTEDSID